MRKEARTYLLTKDIIEAIEKAANNNKVGDSKNTIVKLIIYNCINHKSY